MSCNKLGNLMKSSTTLCEKLHKNNNFLPHFTHRILSVELSDMRMENEVVAVWVRPARSYLHLSSASDIQQTSPIVSLLILQPLRHRSQLEMRFIRTLKSKGKKNEKYKLVTYTTT